jgi:hypothetical protein
MVEEQSADQSTENTRHDKPRNQNNQLSSVSTGLWFVIYLWLPSEECKIVLWKKKEIEDLKDLLQSFRLYFVIVGITSCISTMYYLLL